jgi:hypothetical protein
MATDNYKYDPLRNPQVDYERADLSPRGILYFLVGLFIAAVFIELVIWGMFRFMAHSDVLFPQPAMNPMAAARQVPQARPKPGSALQNTPEVDLSVFPQPRLQTNDAGEMTQYFRSEQKLLNLEQPFTDPSGNVHIPIDQAMKLIEERGLPVRPSTPASRSSIDGGETGGRKAPTAEVRAPAKLGTAAEQAGEGSH